MSNLCALGASESEIISRSRHASFHTVRRHYRFPCTKVIRSSHVVETGLLGVTSDHGFATADLIDLIAVM